jgi:hypothetical protein
MAAKWELRSSNNNNVYSELSKKKLIKKKLIMTRFSVQL